MLSSYPDASEASGISATGSLRLNVVFFSVVGSHWRVRVDLLFLGNI